MAPVSTLNLTDDELVELKDAISKIDFEKASSIYSYKEHGEYSSERFFVIHFGDNVLILVRSDSPWRSSTAYFSQFNGISHWAFKNPRSSFEIPCEIIEKIEKIQERRQKGLSGDVIGELKKLSGK